MTSSSEISKVNALKQDKSGGGVKGVRVIAKLVECLLSIQSTWV